MKTSIHRIDRRPGKAQAIYLSEHEPFLSGNIAKRGVIGKISRKAISPLAENTFLICNSRVNLSVFPLKDLPLPYRQKPDISPGKACPFSTWRKKENPKDFI